MGHQFSKSTVANSAVDTAAAVAVAAVVSSSPQKRNQKRISSSKSQTADRSSQISNRSSATTGAISIPTINLHIEESPNKNLNGANANRHSINSSAISVNSSRSSSLNSVNNCARQIVIKIQLAKMENGNANDEMPVETTLESLGQSTTGEAATDLNANTFESSNGQQQHQQQQQQQILNVKLNTNELVATGGGSAILAGIEGQNTAGGCSIEAPHMFTETSAAAAAAFMNNNNLNGSAVVANLATSSMAMLKLNGESDVDDDDVNDVLLRANSGSSSSAVNENDSSAAVEYCEVLEQPSVDEMWLKRTQESSSTSTSSSTSLAAHVCTDVNISNSCCRNKAKSLAASSSSAAVAAAAATKSKQQRCCKCKCRDVIRGLSNAAIKVLKQKDPIENSERKASATHSRMVNDHRRSTPPVLPNSPSMRVQQQLQQQQQRHRNSIALMPSSSNGAQLSNEASTSSAAAMQNNAPSRVSIWAPTGGNVGDVIIRISTPQCLIERRTSAGPRLRTSRINENHGPAAMRVMATVEGVASPVIRSNAGSSIIGGAPAAVSSNPTQVGGTGGARCNQSRVPIVHSQIDFVHFLVPDLERITNSSFYWGKMDRYEAERLLDGMPEGTFLLRDSAQEEFLFSVTFRKYERSLHARIEQSGHKFSFDSHDPCVFTAPTVTGLLEHYKDPSCVMFFEPMLTVPLHRKNPFSLQQLCRATIVSNSTYDGVNQLELPSRLKSYLKEYHYKQKLRVKPFDEPFYSCT